jgi:hypothetical protein
MILEKGKSNGMILEMSKYSPSSSITHKGKRRM